jgi:hypothetical protein
MNVTIHPPSATGKRYPKSSGFDHDYIPSAPTYDMKKNAQIMVTLFLTAAKVVLPLPSVFWFSARYLSPVLCQKAQVHKNNSSAAVPV